VSITIQVATVARLSAAAAGAIAATTVPRRRGAEGHDLQTEIPILSIERTVAFAPRGDARRASAA
jgi:hypothetical protein